MGRLGLRVVITAVVGAFALAGAVGADAQGSNSGGGTSSSVVPPGQVFSCGVGQTFTKFGISITGNVIQFESPAGKEHILVGGFASGYQVCKSTGGAFTSHSDYGDFAQIGFGPTSCSQPNGPNTFPLECTRTTTDGQLTMTRRITGNSFVGPVPPGTPQFDTFNSNGIGCDHMEECGNCTNRTVHVLTRLQNNTGLGMTVRAVEGIDVDISNSFGNERASRLADSTIVWEDTNDPSLDSDARGILMQALILAPAQTAIDNTSSTVIPPAACVIPTVATPTGIGDFASYVRQDVFLPPLATSTNAVRLHIRRF